MKDAKTSGGMFLWPFVSANMPTLQDLGYGKIRKE
jgi:hypothetical protein